MAGAGCRRRVEPTGSVPLVLRIGCRMPIPSEVPETAAEEVSTADPCSGVGASPGEHRRAVLAVVAAILLMVVLDAEVTAVLGPVLVRELGFGVTSVNISVALVWMFAAVLLILAGDAADRYGRRRLFLWATGLYLLSGLLSGLSSDAVSFFAGRALLSSTRPPTLPRVAPAPVATTARRSETCPVTRCSRTVPLTSRVPTYGARGSCSQCRPCWC